MKFIQILITGFLLVACKNNDFTNSNYLYKIDNELQLKLYLQKNAVLDSNGNSYNIISIPNGTDSSQIHFYLKKALNFTKEKDIFSWLDMEISNGNAHILNSYLENQGSVNGNYFITKYYKTNKSPSFYACRVQYFKGQVAIFYFYDFKSEAEVQKFCENVIILSLSD